MRNVFVPALIWTTISAVAIAAPAVTTTNVNFRTGPGTNYSAVRTVPAGTDVEIGQCDDGGGWCSVSVGGQQGFMSGQYLKETEDPNTWPRTYHTGKGQIVLYQPQFTEWTDYKSIEALVAAEYIKSAGDQPVFGVIGLKGDTYYDVDAGNVVITNVTISSLKFSTFDRDDLAVFFPEIGKLLPTDPITVPEARVAASMAEQKRIVDVQGIKADPPPIFVSKTPALLVQTDGAPAFALMKGLPGLSFLVNTNWDIFRVDQAGALFLRDGTHWQTSPAIDGPWTQVTQLPPLLNDLPKDGNWDDARAALSPEPYPQQGAPKIVTTNQPSELILFDGEPTLVDVPNTSLQWASNTDTDVFLDKTGKQWYVLLSGRWFRASDLAGPWTFATPDLPDDFLNIPEDTPYYAVRASIPGTSESAEARLRASIPTTARVEKGSISPTVTYSGKAQFAPIEGTLLTYATNTSETVIKVGSRYFALQDGVWFVADSPDGPWQLATEVPEEIYDIPPSSHLYNSTYVRVYSTEPNAIWYSYTMGYLNCFLAWDTCVYGTGWYYPPYWYDWDDYDYPIYYPRPVTWGIGAYYNPIRGTYGRYGYAYGPYRGIAGARSWDPQTGIYRRGGVAWGPQGTAGFVAAFNPRTDRAGYVAGGRNVYGAWKSAGVRQGSDWARVTARTGAGGNSTLRWKSSEGQGFVHEGRRGDLYAGRNGEVYRNTGDGWQVFDGGWQDVKPPERGALVEGGEGLRGLSPEARDRLQQRVGGGEALGGLAGVAASPGDRARAGQPPGANRRPAAEQRRAYQRSPAPRPKSQRRSSSQNQVVSRRPPPGLSRDIDARYRGNQREISGRQYIRQNPSYGGGRNFSGGSYGGGGRSFGGGGGRGGGRR